MTRKNGHGQSPLVGWTWVEPGGTFAVHRQMQRRPSCQVLEMIPVLNRGPSSFRAKHYGAVSQEPTDKLARQTSAPAARAPTERSVINPACEC